MRAPAALLLLVLMVFGAVVALDGTGERASANHVVTPGNVSINPITQPTRLDIRFDRVRVGTTEASYEVRYKRSTETNWTTPNSGDLFPANIDNNRRRIAVTALSSGITYEMQVRACIGTDCSAWSGTVSARTKVQSPSHPIGDITASNVGPRTITFTWAHEGTASGYWYVLRSGSKGSTPNNAGTNNGTNKTKTFNTLTPNTQYWLWVRGCNAADGTEGCNAWKSSAAVRTSADKPTTPRDFEAEGGERVSGLSRTRVRLTWNPPSHNHGSAITRYEYQLRIVPGNNWPRQGGQDQVQAVSGGGSARQVDISVDFGSDYEFRIRAVNGVGDGPWTSPIKVSRHPGAPSVTTPSGNDLEPGRITFRWTAPSAGTPIKSYDYQWRLKTEDDSGSWSSVANVTTRHVAVSDLSPNTGYDFRVRALTDHRTGEWGTKSATTAELTDLTITGLKWERDTTAGVALANSNSRANVQESAGQIRINLVATLSRQPTTGESTAVSAYLNISSDAGNANDLTAALSGINNGGFTLNRNNCGASYWDANPTQCRRSIVVTVTQDQIDEQDERSQAWFGFVTSAQGRNFWVSSNNDDRRSVDFYVIDDDTRPGAPTGLTTTTPGDKRGQLDLSWTPPTNRGVIDGATPDISVLKYNVRWKLSSASSYTNPAGTVSGPSTKLPGLLGGESYDVQVRSQTGAGQSAWTTAASGMASTSAPAAPARPSVSRGSGDGFTLTWNAPHDGGSAITSYDWEYKRYRGSGWTRDSATGTSATGSIPGLAMTAYEFRVRAVNAHGESGWSPIAIAATVPNPPGLSVSNSGGSVWFDINNPSNDGGSPILACRRGDFQHSNNDSNIQWRELHHQLNCSTLYDGHTIPDFNFAESGNSLVRARVYNAIGNSAWTLRRFNQNGQIVNAQPSFTETAPVTREIGDGNNIGDPVAATDTDSVDVLRYSLQGADAGQFQIVATSGQIQKKSGVTYDQASYSVTVKVVDGLVFGGVFTPFGGSATIDVTLAPPVMEATGVSSIAITNPAVAESAGTVNVEVLITFNGASVDGQEIGLVTDLVGLAQGATTATRTDDFTARQYVTESGGKFTASAATCGTTEWAVNQCRPTIPVTIVQDALDESDERLNITAAFIKVMNDNDALDPAHTARAVLTITDDDTSAGQVTDLTLTAEEGEVELTWTPPTAGMLDGSAATITGYEVRSAATSGGLSSASWASTGSSSPGLILENLEGGTYHFQVRALNGVTPAGAASNEVSTDVVAPVDERGVTINAASRTVGENGGTATYTIRLESQPSGGDVTITPMSGDTSIATVSGPLVFESDNWEEAQTVTITGVNDDVDNAGEKRATTITHSVSGGDYGGVSAAPVSVEVTDDDADPTVTLALSPDPVTEGQSSTVTATLNRASEGVTTVTVSATAGSGTAASDFTLNGTQLTIPAGQLSSTGSVTIAANQDDDSTDESVTVSGSATNSEGISGPANVTLGITDDDMVGLTVTSSGSNVFEQNPAGRDLYTVKLNTQPSDTVVVDVSSSNANAVTVSPSELTFTTGNWNDAQTVKALPVSDDNAVDELVTITFAIDRDNTLDSEYDGVAAQTRTLTAQDDDEAEIELSTNTLSVTEGATSTYTVKLTAQPTSNVVVNVSSNNAAATVNKSSLTFSTGNWETAQTVTVTAVQDGNTDDATVTITNSVNNAQSANEFDGESESVTVSVTDDDTQLAAPSFTLARSDASIKVTWEPVSDATTYEIAWDCGGTTGSHREDGSPYTIMGLTNGTSCNVTMQSIGSGSNLDSVVSGSMSATPLSDNNDLSALTVSVGSLSPGFSAGTTSYTVMVNFGMSSITVTATAAEPNASVQILVGSNVQTGAITLAQGSTTITVRVTSQLGNSEDYTIVVTRAANMPPQFDGTAPMAISFNENEAGGVDIGAPVSATDSDGGTVTYTLEGTDPGSFEIDGGTGQISTKSITYDHEAKSAYSVTVRASDGQGGSNTRVVEITVDDVAEPPPAPGAPTVSAASMMGHTSLDVSWSAPDTTGRPDVSDYDVQYKVQSETGWSDWTFAGTGTMTTITGLMPGVNYDVRVGAKNDEGGPTWSDSSFGQPDSNQAPAFATNTATRTITETPAGTNEPSGGRNVNVAVTASDGNGDTLTYALSGTDASSFTIDNNGQIKTIGGRHYDREDKATYTVVVTATDPFDEMDTITVTITFTNVAEAAGVPQNVQLTAGVDRITVDWDESTNAGGYIVQWKSGTQAYSDTDRRHVIASGSTTTYTIPGLDPSTEYDVQVIATRDESEPSAASMQKSETPLSALSVASITRENLSEDNANVGGFTLSLNRALVAGETAVITYTISYSTASAADITEASRSEVGNKTHTMTAGDREFTVDIRAVNDNLYEGTTAETISINVTRVDLTGNNNANLNNAVGTVTIADNDSAPTGITVTLTPDTVSEAVSGGSQSVVVKAELSPSGSGLLPSNTPVSFTVTGATAQSTDFTAISGLTVTIPIGDRSAMRTQAFSPVNDIAAEGDETVTFTATATAFGQTLTGMATLTITDDETPGVTVSPTTINVAEGHGSASYTVVLDAEPTSNVVIDITAPSGITVSPSTLTFTPSGATDKWDVEQTVTVTADSDNDDNDENHMISHAVNAGSSADAYDGVTIDDVTVRSYEPRVASITDTATVAENSSVSLTVTLSPAAPTGVPINIAWQTRTVPNQASSGDFGANSGTLTFTAGQSTKTVTVEALDDSLTELDETFQVCISLPGNAPAGVSLANTPECATVTITDDDDPLLSIDPLPSISEGDSGTKTLTFMVSLPANPRTVTVDYVHNATASTADSSDHAPISGGTLTFAANETIKTIPVTVNGDITHEQEELIVLTFSNVQRAMLGNGFDPDGHTVGKIEDDDPRPTTIQLGVDTASISEDDTTQKTVTVTGAWVGGKALDADTTVAISVVGGGNGNSIASIPQDFTLGSGTISLTIPANGNTGTTTFQITAVDDIDFDGGETARVTGDATGFTVNEATIAINDNDSPPITTELSLSGDESVGEGRTITLTVTLTDSEGVTRAGATTVSVNANNAYTVSPASRTIPATQSTTSFTLRAHQDQTDEPTQSVDVAVTLTNPDDNVHPADPIQLMITDDDPTPEITLALSRTTITESSGPNNSATVTATMNRPSSAATTITVSSAFAPGQPPDTAEAGDFRQTGTTLTIPAGSLTSSGSVDIAAAEDDDSLDERIDVSATATNNHAAGEISNLRLTIEDNDTPGITLTELSPINEGGTQEYTVVLNVAPSADVVVRVSPSSTSGVTVDRNELTFTSDNWGTTQTVRVTGEQDDDAVDDHGTITHSVVGGRSASEYRSAPSATLDVSVSDNDRAGFTLSESSLDVDEGESGTFTVELTAAPARGSVRISLVSDNTDSVTVSPSSVTFSAGNWDDARTVTVRARQDNNPVSETVTITASVVDASSSDEFDDVGDQTVTVNVSDDETTTYDSDGDGLIEIHTIEQLNAVRYDLDGNGQVAQGDEAAYSAAFSNPENGVVCPTGTTCEGYELFADLDFDTNGNGRADAGDAYWNGGDGWDPIGDGTTPYNSNFFEGNGHSISNLYIDRAGESDVGLFGATSQFVVISNLGLLNVNIVNAGAEVGALVGTSHGNVVTSYVTGSVKGTREVGAVIGWNHGQVSDIYAVGSVSGAGVNVGGLIGRIDGGSSHLRRGYASVKITNSHGSASEAGVVGWVGNNTPTVEHSYYDTDVVQNSDVTAGTRGDMTDVSNVVGKTGAELRSGAGGIYSNWSAATWDFGSELQFPALKVDSTRDADQTATWQEFGVQLREWPTITQAAPSADLSEVNLGWTEIVDVWPDRATITYQVLRNDAEIASGLSQPFYDDDTVNSGPTYRYEVVVLLDGAEARRSLVQEVMVNRDADGDGLIEITTQAQLNAVRYDLDGDGRVDDRENDDGFSPLASAGGSACPSGTTCTGYELSKDLTLSGNWTPIGGDVEPADEPDAFTAVFEGNGNAIFGLRISKADRQFVGLFGALGSGGKVSNIGLVDASVTGRSTVGALVGQNAGTVEQAFATGSVTGNAVVGGLVGANSGLVTASYSAAAVAGVTVTEGSDRATPSLLGGLVGRNAGTVSNAYATSSVTGHSLSGGLVGDNSGGGHITNSYATGAVAERDGFPHVGGLIGRQSGGPISASYWDTETSGRSNGAGQGDVDADLGKTTAQLQSPTTNTGIYSGWSTTIWDFDDEDTDGDEYPSLIGLRGQRGDELTPPTRGTQTGTTTGSTGSAGTTTGSTGSAGRGQPQIVPVTIRAETPGELTLTVVAAGQGNVRLTINGRLLSVVVTTDEGSIGVRLVISASDDAINQLQALSFETETDQQIADAAPQDIPIAGSQPIVTITLRGSGGQPITLLAEQATVCLPLSDETLEQAGASPLSLLHFDDPSGWTPLSGSQIVEIEGVTLLCAETTEFSPFAIGIGAATESEEEEAETVETVDEAESDEQPKTVVLVETAADCLRGALHRGFSLVLFGGGSAEQLSACLQRRGVEAAWTLEGGRYRAFGPLAPELVNRAFTGQFADTVPAMTPLWVAADAASSDAATAPLDWSGENCFDRAPAVGDNLVVFAGGSVSELAVCGLRHNVQTFYAFDEHGLVSYEFGRSEIRNGAFRSLFTEGLPAATPLIARVRTQDAEAQTEQPAAESDDPAEPETEQPQESTGAEESGETDETASAEQKSAVRLGVIVNTGLVGVFHRDDCRVDAGITTRFGWLEGDAINIRRDGTGRCADWLYAQGPDGVESWVHSRYVDESGTAQPFAIAASDMTSAVVVNTAGQGVALRSDCRSDARLSRSGWSEGRSLTVLREGVGRCNGWVFAQGPGPSWSWVHLRFLQRN